MDTIRWGMIGCGDVAEVKSGPALQKADGSALVAVMRRERDKAEDYARRHDVPRVHARAEDLIDDAGRRRRLHRDAAIESLRPRPEGRGRRQAVPGRKADGDESRGVSADGGGVPRRPAPSLGCVLPARAAAIPESARAASRARDRTVDVDSRQRHRPACHSAMPRKHGASTPSIAGAGLFLDLASHYFDIIDFLAGPITAAAGFALNTGGSYAAEDVTASGVSDWRQGRGHRRLELQRSCVGRLDRIHRLRGGHRNSGSRRRGCRRHARRPTQSLSVPQPSARAPAADSNDRRRASRDKGM